MRDISDSNLRSSEMIIVPGEPIGARVREMAIFVIGLDTAFRQRGYPGTYPRRLINRAVETALRVAGRVGRVERIDSLKPEHRGALRTMQSVAENFGFDQVRD